MTDSIKLLLIGGGGHCRSCIDVIRATRRYDIVGILDVAEKVGSFVDGVEVLAEDAELEKYLELTDECLVSVGQINSADLRKKLYKRVEQYKGKLATVISPRAHVSDSAKIGRGTIVMHDAIVNAGAQIAENVILNSFSLVEHDASVGSHTHLSTRSTINGGARVGDACFIGSHSVVFNHCHIDAETIVGGGQIVRSDLLHKSKPIDVVNHKRSTFIIAEAGVNHNGDIAAALEMIDVAAAAGADAVKFQTFKAEALSTQYAEKAEYQKQTTAQSESQQEMLKALELPESEYVNLVARCEKKEIEFMSTAFDMDSMDFLIDLGIKRIKIPSGELTNVPFVRHCAGKGLPIILSTGMASMNEVSAAVEVVLSAGLPASELSILHCNTAYPTPFSDANLLCIPSFLQAHKGIGSVGYSDHTLGDEAIVASLSLGANIIEKHFTLDRTLPGPDQATSLEPRELNAMVEKVRNIERALGDGIKKPSPSEKENIAIARKSIVARKSIRQGDILSEENITTKRPATGISAHKWDDIIGSAASRSFQIDEQIEL